MQFEGVAHERVITCAFDQPGEPSKALDQGSTLDVQDAPPSSVRMMTVRCTPALLSPLSMGS
jgi:hypothetical protein